MWQSRKVAVAPVGGGCSSAWDHYSCADGKGPKEAFELELGWICEEWGWKHKTVPKNLLDTAKAEAKVYPSSAQHRGKWQSACFPSSRSRARAAPPPSKH